jgi:hypothetical protein
VSVEIWVILGLAVLFGGYGAWSALTTRDSWDRRPQSMAGEPDEWDFHKATLGIPQEPGEQQWQKDLAALHFERKHPYC